MWYGAAPEDVKVNTKYKSAHVAASCAVGPSRLQVRCVEVGGQQTSVMCGVGVQRAAVQKTWATGRSFEEGVAILRVLCVLGGGAICGVTTRPCPPPPSPLQRSAREGQWSRGGGGRGTLGYTGFPESGSGQHADAWGGSDFQVQLHCCAVHIMVYNIFWRKAPRTGRSGS